MRVLNSDHPLFRYPLEKSLTWYLHGWFDAPEGATVLAVNEAGKPILYVDDVSSNGRLIVTSIDPLFHHGSHFMPATTRFLKGPCRGCVITPCADRWKVKPHGDDPDMAISPR